MISLRPLEDLLLDLRYAIREMRRSVGFTLVAVFSLAIGIGAVTATLTIVDAFMLRGLPVREPERLVAFSVSNSAVWRRWTYASFSAWRESPDARFEAAAVSNASSVNVKLSRSNDTATVRVALASGNYFQVIGAEFAAGRPFTPAEDRVQGGTPVAVISEAFWARWFGRAPDVVGKVIELLGVPYEVVGVAGRGFAGDHVGQPTDVWIPLAMQPAVAPSARRLLEDRWGTGERWLRIIARLHADATQEDAAASANLINQRFIAEKAAALGQNQQQVVRERKEVVLLLSAARGYAPERERYARPLMILSGITVLVLVVACANFTNLMLTRAEARRKEFVIRLALGGGRWRLVRQSATECVMLALVAGGCGLLVAIWATGAFLKQFAAMIQPVEFALDVDARVLGIAGTCVASVMAFGLWPSTRPVRAAALPSLNPAASPATRERPRGIAVHLMLVAQLALCTVLLIVAGLLLRTVTNLRSQELGFDRNVVLVPVSPGEAGYSGEAAAMLIGRITERLRAIRGIESIGLSGPGLLNYTHYWIDGSQLLSTEQGAVAAGARWTSAAVGAGFFHAIGAPLVAGREFDERDASPGANAVVINRTMATLLFGHLDPIGRYMGTRPGGARQIVVGVVNDTKQISPRDRGMAVVYVPLRGHERVVLAVRTSGRAAEAVPIVRHQLEALAKDLPIGEVRTIADVLDEAIAQERLLSALALGLGALVVVIGCVGLYALMAYDVARRTHELGIRLALGATRERVMAMVMKDGARMSMPGLVCGVPLGIAASRPLASQLYGVESNDPWTVATVGLLLVGVTLVATYRPAHTASRIDPLVLLRKE